MSHSGTGGCLGFQAWLVGRARWMQGEEVLTSGGGSLFGGGGGAGARQGSATWATVVDGVPDLGGRLWLLENGVEGGPIDPGAEALGAL